MELTSSHLFTVGLRARGAAWGCGGRSCDSRGAHGALPSERAGAASNPSRRLLLEGVVGAAVVRVADDWWVCHRLVLAKEKRTSRMSRNCPHEVRAHVDTVVTQADGLKAGGAAKQRATDELLLGNHRQPLNTSSPGQIAQPTDPPLRRPGCRRPPSRAGYARRLQSPRAPASWP